ncbi:MAG: YitT family protein, partial [Bacteroidetes bacterium]|nr:YitT family protein [Fibrella sp.]
MHHKLTSPWRIGKDIAFILAGIISAGMGLKGFLLSSHFIDGGVTGISMLIANTTTVPLSALLLLINLPFVVLGYRQIGWSFAVKSAL